MGTDESSKSNDVTSSSALEMREYLDSCTEKTLDELVDAVYEIYYLEQLGGGLQPEMLTWRRKPPTPQHVQYTLTNCDQEIHELLTSRLPSLAEPSTPSLLTPISKSDPLSTGSGAVSQPPVASSVDDCTSAGSSNLPFVSDSTTSSSYSSPISVVPSSESSVKISSSAALAAASAVHTYSSSTSKAHSSRTNVSSNGSNSTSNSNLLNTLPSTPTPNVPHVADSNMVSAPSQSASSNRPQVDHASANSGSESLSSFSQNEGSNKSALPRSTSTPGNNLNSISSPSIKPVGNLTSQSPCIKTPSSNRPGGYGNRSYATRQKSISASFDAAIGNSQEQIVQKAQQEAQVMQRIAELRKQGIWSTKKLPKVQEPPREKAHWDFLLEEMTWLSTDFAQERKWKKNAAKKCALMIARYHKEKDQAKEKEKREELQRLRKIASTIAKEVRTFWSNVEKLVEYKQQTALEKKRKQVMDMHLNFIVGQTEQYTEWLTEGFKPLVQTTSAAPSISTSATEIDDFDADISMDSLSDKRTSKGRREDENDDLSTEAITSSVPETADDGDFDPQHVNPDEGEDDEETIAKADETENLDAQKEEIACLANEMDVPLEELLPKEILEALGGQIPSAASLAYLPPRSASASEVETATEEEDDDEDPDEDEEDDDEDEDEDEVEVATEEADVPMDTEEDQGKQIHELADALQPKGITLETATVKTTVPFLLRGSLREYQHIGLDWLVAMYEKRLNGILADEMGLGKTIQTIALLAHLACEKGIWGPHLIVVPTSVMLNWEMEFKKWCPSFKTLTYYGSQKERRAKRQVSYSLHFSLFHYARV